jgi:hypothetical protein
VGAGFLKVHVVGVGYSTQVPFEFVQIAPARLADVGQDRGCTLPDSPDGGGLARSSSILSDAIMPSPSKSLGDITWQDFMSAQGRQKFAEMSLSDDHHHSREELIAARTIQHAFRRHLKAQRSRRKAVALIESTYQQYKQREKSGRAQEEAAAVKIQSRFRGYKEKMKYARSRKAIVAVQRLIRDNRRQDNAARTIQRFMKNVRDTKAQRVYHGVNG